MSEKYQGIFSQSFMSLQIQLKTLLEGSGGNSSIELLDALSKLGKHEQEVVINSFLVVINKIANGEKRYLTDEDYSQKEMEDNLYSEIVCAMSEAAKVQNIGGRRLEVLEGGKRARKSKPLFQISSATRAKKLGLKPVIN